LFALLRDPHPTPQPHIDLPPRYSGGLGAGGRVTCESGRYSGAVTDVQAVRAFVTTAHGVDDVAADGSRILTGEDRRVLCHQRAIGPGGLVTVVGDTIDLTRP
jgi:hypothetical protein